MKRKGIPLWVGILIVSVAIVGVIALLVADIAKNEWKIDVDILMRPMIILAGLILTLVKLITRSGGSLKHQTYHLLATLQIAHAVEVFERILGVCRMARVALRVIQ